MCAYKTRSPWIAKLWKTKEGDARRRAVTRASSEYAMAAGASRPQAARQAYDDRDLRGGSRTKQWAQRPVDGGHTRLSGPTALPQSVWQRSPRSRVFTSNARPRTGHQSSRASTTGRNEALSCAAHAHTSPEDVYAPPTVERSINQPVRLLACAKAPSVMPR